MSGEGPMREPTASERAILERLTEIDFPGRGELARLLRRVRVRVIDSDGGLAITSAADGRAPVVKRIPVEAEYRDDDGVRVHVLLHVIDGRPVELEVLREDGASPRRPIPAGELELSVLPPAPRGQ